MTYTRRKVVIPELNHSGESVTGLAIFSQNIHVVCLLEVHLTCEVLIFVRLVTGQYGYLVLVNLLLCKSIANLVSTANTKSYTPINTQYLLYCTVVAATTFTYHACIMLYF